MQNYHLGKEMVEENKIFQFGPQIKQRWPFPKNFVLLARSSTGNRNKISFREDGNKINGRWGREQDYS